MRLIGVVTTARSDYGIYLPVLRRIEADDALGLRLIVSGMHLSADFGMTVEVIEEDGFAIADRVESLASSDAPLDIGLAMSKATAGFAESYARARPDILVVLGDRFEMFPAALAALPFGIPVAHIHGGELTQGAIDDALRHAITKLSHLHFTTTTEYARRIMQMGEEPWRVTVCGAPALDNLKTVDFMTRSELAEECGFKPDGEFLLVTFHPVTLEQDRTEQYAAQLFSALERFALPVIITMANADTGGRLINHMIRAFAERCDLVQAVDNLGTRAYFSTMKLATAMVGNSSSGIIEAASFGLPVVNIGTRQAGRVRGANVIDTGYETDEILAGIQRAVSDEFRRDLREMVNPYGSGNAAEAIVDKLKSVQLDERLIVKRFVDATLPEGDS